MTEHRTLYVPFGDPQDDIIGPAATGSLAVDGLINTELALYNRTGNVLALWAVFAICTRHGVRMPEQVESRLGMIAEKLVKLARDETVGATKEVPDLVLGTKNETGGHSPFESYAHHKRREAIIRRVLELLMQDVEQLQDHTITRRETKSQTEVYEAVAREYRLEPETIKRTFEADNREAGSFHFGTLRKPSGDV